MTDDDGAIIHLLDFEDQDFERLVLRHEPEDHNVVYCYGYEENAEEPSYQTAFQRRELTFDPISIIGRGESNRVEGVSTSENIEEVPTPVNVALNSIGMALVPNGDEWL